jgi:hypothetical protein
LTVHTRILQIRRLALCCLLLVAFSSTLHAQAQAQAKPASIDIHWNKTVIVSRSTATLQVVVNPMLRRGSPIHGATFAALKALGADYVRYVPWLPYPRLAVAELQPPTKTSTSWDFSAIDPMTLDFLNATKGHYTVMNFSTIPQWMFKVPTSTTPPEGSSATTTRGW